MARTLIGEGRHEGGLNVAVFVESFGKTVITPERYRVVCVATDGREVVGEWFARDGQSWEQRHRAKDVAEQIVEMNAARVRDAAKGFSGITPPRCS